MLKSWTPGEMPDREEMKIQLEKTKSSLYDLQMKIKEHKLPVLVLFEGWSAAGKGSMIGKVIKNIDPRFFKAATMSSPTEEELRRPFLYRYMKQIPEEGKFTFLDSGWMEQTVMDVLTGDLEGDLYEKRIESIRRFERQLTDNGYLVLKFFMQIDKDEQGKRMEKLLDKEDTKWRVTGADKWQHKHYKKCENVIDRYMKDTNMSTSPWYIIDAEDKKWAELQVMDILVSSIEVALQNQSHSVPILQNVFPLVKMPKLKDVELEGKTIGDEVLHNTLIFFVMYMLIVAVSTLLVASFDECDFTTNLTAVIACMGNIGPGLGKVGPMGNFSEVSALSKIVLTLDMLIGRLEIFPIIMVFTPETWKKV